MNTYLWFFVAFLSGWAMRVVVGNLADLIQNRRFSSRYPASALWNCFLGLLVVEMWVATPFASDSDSPIGTGAFLLFILLPTAATLMAYLLQPEIGKYEPLAEAGGDGSVEADDEPRPTEANVRTLEQAFNDNRAFFFGILLALPVLSVLREVVAGEFVLTSSDLGFRALIALGAVIGFFVRTKRANTALAAAMVMVIVAYTLVVFPYVATAN